MSWNNGLDRIAAALRSPWPITLRLALLFFGASALILLSVSGVLYTALEDKLEIRDRAGLVDYALGVQQALLESSPGAAGAEPDWLHKAEERALGSLRFQMRVLTGAGQVVVETPDMDAAVADFPAAAEAPASDMTAVKWMSDAGETYLLTSAWVTQGNPQAPRYRLQIAFDLTESETILDSYKRELLLVLGLALLAAAGAAAAIVYVSLRPLRAFTRVAGAVRSDSLGVRLGAGRWPAELLGLARAFDEMLERLEEAFERLSRFSSDLAHEFRTPMQNLIASTTVVLSRDRSNAEYQALLDASLREYERLNRMVDQMLFIARSENAQLPLQREWLSSETEFAALLDFFGIAAEEAAVSLQVAGTVRIWADRGLLRQAVSNLLSNALHHTPAGGVIQLHAGNDPDGAAIVSVEDSGPGIAAQHLPRLFDRFYRADFGRSRQGSGAGLGLAIVHTIARLHGGEVHVDGREGHGARFVLRLPTDGAPNPE